MERVYHSSYFHCVHLLMSFSLSSLLFIRKLLGSLYTICHPFSLEFGGIEDITASSIPETRAVTQVISQWLADASFCLDPKQARLRPRFPSPRTFFDEILEILTLGRHYDVMRLREVIQRSGLFNEESAPVFLKRRSGATLVYVLHDLWSFVDASERHFIFRGIYFVE